VTFNKITFPVVRRCVSKLIAQQITSVQPMTGISSGILELLHGPYRGPCTSQDLLNSLFYISRKFNELFPVGSEVNLDVGSRVIFTTTKTQPEKLIVKSESYVLSNLSVVGFLSDKSDDDTHMYYVQDLIEYQLILKEINNEGK